MASLSAAMARAIGVVILTSFVIFVRKLYATRMKFRRLATEHGIKIMPHSFLLGHLIEVGKAMAKYPPDVCGSSTARILMLEYPEYCEDDLVYFDCWPIAYPLLAVFHPDMAAQFCQSPSQPKHELIRNVFKDFSHGMDLVTQEGPEWKMWRSLFNPGFSSKNVASLVPAFVEESLVFKNYLVDMARLGEVFQLEVQGMKATCDIIGRAVLGTRLHIQTTQSPLYDSLKKQISWLLSQGPPSGLLRVWHPLRPFYMWNNNRIMRNELEPHIKKQMLQPDEPGAPKTINALAMKALRTSADGKGSSSELDSTFMDNAIAQLKSFLFAGHDTTSSTLCFIYYHLWRSPDAMQKVRCEHDEVFGSDPSQAADMIKRDPSLLNRLPFCTAVIKEVLRLHPAVGSVRAGAPGLFLVHPGNGRQFPTEGFLLHSVSHALQRNERYWPSPDEFIPERWLCREGDPLYPVKNAFRPFELGPRNCIGQELAQTELRLLLALTLRELDIVPAFPEDAAKVFGEVMYQANAPGQIVAHPRDGMPVKVHLRATKNMS